MITTTKKTATFVGTQGECSRVEKQGLIEFARIGARSLDFILLHPTVDPVPAPGDLDLQRSLKERIRRVERLAKRPGMRAAPVLRRAISALSAAIRRDPEGLSSCYLGLTGQIAAILEHFVHLRLVCSRQRLRLIYVLKRSGQREIADALSDLTPFPETEVLRSLPGDMELQCARQADVIQVERLAKMASQGELPTQAYSAAAGIAVSIEQDPEGIEFYSYLAERLADAVFQRRDVRFRCTEVYLMAALLLVLCGEPDVAEVLLKVVIWVLDKAEQQGAPQSEISANRALALIALAKLASIKGNYWECIKLGARGWRTVQFASAYHRVSVAEQFAKLLEEKLVDLNAVLVILKDSIGPATPETRPWILSPGIWKF